MRSLSVSLGAGRARKAKAWEVLAGAALLLKTKGHCKDSLAVRADGTPTYESDPGAVAFCAIGALELARRSAGLFTWGYADQLVMLTVDPSKPHGIVPWNNAPERTADEVIQAFDAAYVLAIQEEGLEPEDVL